MATHSSILAWRIPVDRGACRLQSIGSQRVGYDRESHTHTHTHTHTHPFSKTIALQLNSLSTFCFLCLENASFFIIQLIPNQPNCQLPKEVFSDPAGRAVSVIFSQHPHFCFSTYHSLRSEISVISFEAHVSTTNLQASQGYMLNICRTQWGWE